MKANMISKAQGRAKNVEKDKLVLRFVCPECGSRDLRTKMLVARYPVATLDGIEVDAGTLEFEELHQREDPFEWMDSNHNDGWEFWCDKCHLVPDLDQYDDEKTQEDQLARWLLDKCPQSEEEHGKTRALTFTCPECGSQRLDWVHDGVALREQVWAVSDDNSIVWGASSYGGNEATEEYFQCHGCDLILRDEDGDEVDEESLGQWLRANCTKEQEQSAQTE